MRGYWAQPSLSRDFALLAAAILFVLFLLTSWITYSTYSKHSDRIAAEMAQEAERIERALASEMESANYLLTALGRQIILDKERDLVRMAQTFKSFDNKGYIYSIFSWIGPEQQVVVSSNRGVLEKPMDVSDRDYVKKAMAEPWKMQIGRPIEGRVSERWVIPVAMGLTDYTGKFVGTVMVSIDINTLTERLSNLVRRSGLSFAIVSKTLIPLTQVSDDKDFVTDNFPTPKLVNVNFSERPSGLIAQGNLFLGTGNYSFYRVSADYPYIILLGYDSRYGDEMVQGMVWSRLMQMLVIALFLVLFLWIMRLRMIKPVLDLTHVAASVAKGNSCVPLPVDGPVEIEGLASQIHRVSEYIDENKRIENELRNKMFMLKSAKERAEIDRRSKSEFLAYMCQEMRLPLTNIIGFAQVMRDQLYGPIENRKYRQYASDIYQSGNSLLGNLHDLLELSRVETEHSLPPEVPVDIEAAVKKAVQMVAERTRTEKPDVHVQLGESLPKLIADEFRLQQVFANLILYVNGHSAEDGPVSVAVCIIHENKEKSFLAITVAAQKQAPYDASALIAIVEQTLYAAPAPLLHDREVFDAAPDLGLELVRSLVASYRGHMDIRRTQGGALTVNVFFDDTRLRFSPPQS